MANLEECSNTDFVQTIDVLKCPASHKATLKLFVVLDPKARSEERVWFTRHVAGGGETIESVHFSAVPLQRWFDDDDDNNNNNNKGTGFCRPSPCPP